MRWLWLLTLLIPSVAFAQLDPALHHFGDGSDGELLVTGTFDPATETQQANRLYADAVSAPVTGIDGTSIDCR